MGEDWELSEAEFEAMLAEQEALDRAAAEYLEERLAGLGDPVPEDEARWLDALAGTVSPTDEPADDDLEGFSAVLALEHVDWLALALGVVRRGAGAPIDPEQVQADVDGLDDVDGVIEDAEGHLGVLGLALSYLAPTWEDLGVLDDDGLVTERGVRGLPRALHRAWRDERAPTE